MYTQKLPPMHKLDHLVKLAGPFPTTAREIMSVAKDYGLGPDIVHFMRQFPPYEVFDSSEDFAARCYELNVLIKQEREAPEEALRSPQD